MKKKIKESSNIKKKEQKVFGKTKTHLDLQKTEERYRSLLEHLPVGIYRTIPEGNIIEANQALADILGYENVLDLRQVNVNDFYIKKGDRIDHLKKLDASKTYFAEFEFLLRNGKTIWVRDYPRAVTDKNGNILYYDGILVDITKRKQAEELLKLALEEVRNLSLTDELTGLYNRRGFFTLAQQQLKMASRMKGNIFLLFVDLDNLKVINDSLGHSQGDAALIETANVLRKSFREADIIGRIGGDEFAILANETSESSVEILKERLAENIGISNSNKVSKFNLSVSIGVVLFKPDSSISLDELLAKADRLMYIQKKQKRKS